MLNGMHTSVAALVTATQKTYCGMVCHQPQLSQGFSRLESQETVHVAKTDGAAALAGSQSAGVIYDCWHMTCK